MTEEMNVDVERVLAEMKAMYGEQALQLAIARSCIPLTPPPPSPPPTSEEPDDSSHPLLPGRTAVVVAAP